MVFQQGACGLKENGSGPAAGSGLEAFGFVPEVPKAFSNELRTTEFVLRGGFLPEPVVLTNLELIGGKAFFRYNHKHTHLCKFLTGRNAYLHPLANTYLGELLAQLRDERLLSMACAAPVEDEVVLDDLGLDDGPPVSATSSSESTSAKRLRGLGKRDALRQHPTVEIKFPVSGSDVVPMLIATHAKCSGAASFEATPRNFKALFDWIRLETPAREQRDEAEQRRPRAKAQHDPIVTEQGRQYYRADKQVFFVKEFLGDKEYRTHVSVPKSKGDRLGAGPAKRPRKKAAAAESNCSSSGGRLADGSSVVDSRSEEDI